MPSSIACVAFGCSNHSGGSGTGFFRIPNPETKPQLCKRWLHALSLKKFSFKTFKYSKDHCVCSDHFTPDCFKVDIQSRVMGKPERKLLSEDAVPSIFAHRPQPRVRESSRKRIAAAEARAYIESVLAQPSTPKAPKKQSTLPELPSSSMATPGTATHQEDQQLETNRLSNDGALDTEGPRMEIPYHRYLAASHQNLQDEGWIEDGRTTSLSEIPAAGTTNVTNTLQTEKGTTHKKTKMKEKKKKKKSPKHKKSPPNGTSGRKVPAAGEKLETWHIGNDDWNEDVVTIALVEDLPEAREDDTAAFARYPPMAVKETLEAMTDSQAVDELNDFDRGSMASRSLETNTGTSDKSERL